MSCFLLLMFLNDRQVFRATSEVESPWLNHETWNQRQELPDKFDRVLIPGRDDQRRSAAIEVGTLARTASLMVGTTRGSDGTLAIRGRLNVSGSMTAAERQAGRMYLGQNGGSGVVMQEPGSLVVVSRSLRLGYDSNGDGRYYVNDATLRAIRTLYLATRADTVGLLDLSGSSVVETRDLWFGEGTARLQVVATNGAMPIVNVSERARLSGNLRVDLRDFSGTPNEIPLIVNGGTVAGGFRNVRIVNGTQHYELSYFGGGGRDVVLKKQEPFRDFEEWQASHFAPNTDPETSGPFADPDGDGVSNLTEYKLGCCPHTNEGEPFQVETDSSGQQYVRYIERFDREDVRLVPQVSADGRVWSSEPLDVRIITEFGNTRVVRATADIPNAKFRFAVEMMPDESVKPNVLFVVIDDLNDWTEGLKGHPESLTPNLNRIARRGMRFTRAYSQAALCNPSRTSFLTGRRPSSTGIYGLDGDPRDSPVLANAITLPENFESAGYRIAGGGKFFHRNPLLSTWDDYFPSLTENRIRDPLPPNRPLNGITNAQVRWFDWGPVDVDDEEMGDAQVATWAEGQLANMPTDRPNFLSCGFFRPHLPLYVPPKYFVPWGDDVALPPGVLAGDANDLPETALAWIDALSGRDHQSIVQRNEWRNAVRGYLACVYFADRQLGRVLDALDKSPSLRNTIVIVTSDHGWQLGQKTAWRKETLWEASTRVPLIVSAPGITKPGSECHEVVSLLDIYPTLNDLCDLNPIGTLEGESFAPQLRNPLTARTTPAVSSRYFSHSVRDKRWRYILYENGEEELYDHSVDEFEHDNLATDPAFRDVMDNLKDWVPTNAHPPVGDD